MKKLGKKNEELFYYVHTNRLGKLVGMARWGESDDESEWVTFTKTEAQGIVDRREKPLGAKKPGLFSGVEIGSHIEY